MRTTIKRISSIFMIVLMTGIFCPLLAATPKDSSNENRIAAKGSNNPVGMNLPGSLNSLGTSSISDTSFPILSTFKTVMTNTTSWDTVAIATPYVLFDSQAGLYKMWYWAMSNPVYLPPYYVYRHVIAYAESMDGVTWTNKTVVQDTGSGTYHITGAPYALKENGTYLMWHMEWYEWVGADWSKYITRMSSSDGVTWPAFQSSGDQKVLSAQGQSNPQGDGRSVSEPWVIYTLDQGYTMWYSVYDYPAIGTVGPQKIWTTTSTDGVSWTNRQLSLPYVPGSWEANVAHPSVVKEDDGTYTMYYAAAFANGSSSIGFAQSLDGISWTNRTQLLKPSDLRANITSINDPSYFQDVDGNSYLYFTYYDGQTKFGRVQLSNALQLGRTYGGPGDDCFLSMIQTMDEGFALAGYTNSFGAGGYDYWLVKTDSSGNTQWNRTYGGPGDDEACCVVQTSDGGYALAGYTNSFGAGRYVFWLIKTDGLGNMQWNQTYGGAGDWWTECVIPTTDGGYAMAGYGYNGGYYCLLVKTDEFGRVLWIRTYGGLGASLLFSIVQITDGGYAMAGLTYTSANLHDSLLVKTDAYGNLQWSNTYGGPGNDVAYSLIQTSDGYALAGYTDSYGSGGTDFYVVKTDSSGNMQWNQTYGGPGDEQANTIYRTVEGGYLIMGYTSSFGTGGYDFWVVTTDCYGNMYERKTFGGPGNEFCYGGVQTKDGGYTVCGCTHSYGAGKDDGVTYAAPLPKYTYDKKKLAKQIYGSDADLESMNQYRAADEWLPSYADVFCAPTAAADCLAWFAEANPKKYGNLIPHLEGNDKLEDKYIAALYLGPLRASETLNWR